MKTVPLVESYSAAFDNTGSGVVTAGPKVYATYWHITRITTTCTSPNTNQVTFTVYRNDPNNTVGGSYSGQSDSDDVSLKLQFGEKLVGSWVGGNGGDTGIMTIFGEVTNLR